MQSAFIATCPNSNEAVIVVLGVTTVSEFRAAAAAQGLIRTCDDEEGYEFYKPLQAWAVLTPEGTWDLGASSDAPDALPAMVATARWVSITSCQCEACPVNEGTHKPAGALLQIDEPKSSVNQVDEAINSLLRAALIEGGCSAERVIEAREETNLRRAELRTLLSTPQPCSRSHPHEEMTPMCELRTEIARLTNALARAEAQLAAAPQAVPARVIAGAVFDFAGYLTTLPHKEAIHCSEAHEAAPMVEAITEWCKRRNLTTDGAKVETWRDHLAEAPAHPAEGVPEQAAKLPPLPEPTAFLVCKGSEVTARAWNVDQMRAYAAAALAATHPPQQGMDAQDAARYRWLRNHGFQSAWAELGSDLDGAPFVCFVMRVHIPEPISLPYEEQEWTAGDTDTAIDAALAAQAKQGEQP